MSKNKPNYFVWNLGTMKYIFGYKPFDFCEAMPESICITANNDYNKLQSGGNNTAKKAIMNHKLSDEDKNRLKPFIDNISGIKIEDMFKKLLPHESNIQTYTDMFWKLLKLALSTEKENQFAVTHKDTEYIKIINIFLYGNNELSDESVDLLVRGREISKKYFKRINDRGRFKSYLSTETERVIIKNKLKTSEDSDEYSLCDLVFRKINNTKCHDSISLHGIGGTGKTFQLLSLYDLIINNETSNCYCETIPFYLELNDIHKVSKNCILSTLSQSLEIELSELVNIFNSVRGNVILLLDGYNEVTDSEIREDIAKRICDLRRDYNTRIIITSRLDHSDMFNRMNRGEMTVFTQAEVQPLTDEQVDEYFRKKKVYNKENHTIKKYHDLSSSERKLVQTAQGLSMLGALLKKDSSVKVTNLGSLLLRHINDIILEDVKDRSFETYLKEIAYHMVLVGRFDLSLKELQKYFKSKGVINCNPILENVYVKKLFNKDVRGNYEWIHQNHRDLYCGLKLCDLAVEIDNNIAEFTPNNVTTNDEILTLCGDVISDDRLLQESIYKLKNISSFDYSYALSVLVKIFAYKNNNYIYGLDLAGLDLSKISLAGYILYSKSSEGSEGGGRISSKAITLDNAIVSDKTFETSGLKRGASTVCKYEKNGTEYIVAFCSDNLVIYNTKTAEWESKKHIFNDNTHKLGWINCACHIQDKKMILLGTDNGYITYFTYDNEPTVNTDPRFFLRYNEKCTHPNIRNATGIESIIRVKDSSNNTVLIASNSYGDVFVLNSDIVLHSTTNDSFVIVRNDFLSEYGEENFSVCKLSYTSNYLYYSWGNVIYRCLLSNITDNVEFDPWLTFENKCIFDMYLTQDYCIVNLGKIISIYSFDKQLICSYTYEEKGHTKQDKLKRFTKISPLEEYKNKIIVGVKAEDQDRNSIPNYILLSLIENQDEDGDDECYCKPYPIWGISQTMTTFSAVSFKQDEHIFIATTSNDRSVQILSADQEDFKATKHLGTYDGIHHIELISNDELLLAQYDGSVSHWKFKNNEWRCLDVYPIHKGWVWKVKYYRNKDGSELFFSCSYDGTLKCTNMKSYETQTILEAQDRIIDFTLLEANHTIKRVIAITPYSIIQWHSHSQVVVPPINIKEEISNTHYPEFQFKSITVDDFEEDNKIIVAINFYANSAKGQEGKVLEDTSQLYILDLTTSKLCLYTEKKSIFSNFKKIEEIAVKDGVLLISGLKKIQGKTISQIEWHMINNQVESLDFSFIQNRNEIRDRSIVYKFLKDGQIYIGCLDGSVFVLDINLISDSNSVIKPSFQTHANLISTFFVDMKKVTWAEGSQKDDFKGYFKNL